MPQRLHYQHIHSRPDLYPPVTTLDGLPMSDAAGFIYRITDLLTGKFYIGMKALKHATKKKASQKEKDAALALNSKSRIKIVRGQKESDWVKYWGSCKQLKEDVILHGEERFLREIIVLCPDKKSLGFCEVEQMIKHDVLRSSSSRCYNDNILGRYYRRDLENL